MARLSIDRYIAVAISGPLDTAIFSSRFEYNLRFRKPLLDVLFTALINISYQEYSDIMERTNVPNREKKPGKDE